MANNIKKLRLKRGWTQEVTAEKLGLSKSGYEKIERSERGLKTDRIAKLASLFEVSQSEVFTEDDDVKIVGEIQAAGLVKIYVEDDPGNLRVPRPHGAGDGMVALLVNKGVTLPGFAEENWIVYYEHKIVAVPEDWIGSLCFVQTENGERHVRRVFHGRDRETFDLALSGFETIRNVRIAWSAKIEWIKPR